MNRYCEAFDCLGLTQNNPEKLKTALRRFEDIRSSIDSSLDAVGLLMFWASAGSNNGDYRIPANESVSAIWKIGELMQLLIELKGFCETNEALIECSIKSKTAQ